MFLIRKSALEAYVRCPYMFKVKFYRDEDEEEQYAGQFAALGTRFHDWAHQFFSYASQTDPNQWETLIPTTFNWEERRWARNFINFERRRWKILHAEGREGEWMPVMRELSLTSTVWGIRGTIDRVDWYDRNANLVVIVEYKTTLRMDYTSLRRQLHFYALLYETADQPTIGTVYGIACYNPRLDQHWFEPLNSRSMGNVQSWIRKIQQSIEEDNFPRKQNVYTCMYCDVGCTFEEEV